jgi:hypothetical protein
MLSIHSGREVPWVFGIEGITDHNFPGSIGAALLKMVAIRYSVIVMAGAASLLRTVRHFAIYGYWVPIESLQNDLFMQRDLGGDRGGIDEAE